MDIQVTDLQNEIETEPEKIAAQARKILDALECPEGELSILLVDDARMSALNRQYRGRAGSTNVLAFAMGEGEFAEISPELLGDVVISVPTARRQSEEAGLSLDAMMCRLLIHGILHLFGFDHEQGEGQALEMEHRSAQLLALFE
jgi:probable rRNA maturation factor